MVFVKNLTNVEGLKNGSDDIIIADVLVSVMSCK